jgi:hypothetical protein
MDSRLSDVVRHASVVTDDAHLAHAYWGLEYDWFCFDLVGHVAVFTNAGFGPVPTSVVQHDRALQDWFDSGVVLPRRGACIAMPTDSGTYSDWIALAEQGFFTFDWHNGTLGRYRRLTAPGCPLHVDALPTDLAELVRLVKLDLCFASTTDVDLLQLDLPVVTLPA